MDTQHAYSHRIQQHTQRLRQQTEQLRDKARRQQMQQQYVRQPFSRYDQRRHDDMTIEEAHAIWLIPKLLCAVFALSLIAFGVWPPLIDNSHATFGLLMLAVAMQLALVVPVAYMLRSWNTRLVLR